jgi:tripartite-type tricarboxylate transporter receptor subunit TctC
MLARRRFLHLAGFAAASSAMSRLASADTYPSRPLRWIVPFPAGGSTDLIARLMGEWLAARLGQPVIIENAINPSLFKSLPFDFQRDIAPVAGLAELPLVLDVTPTLPANTVPEFIAYAKANPGKINFASFGVRTISQLAIELFKISTGVDVVHVPYQGGAPMLTDLLSGRIQAGVDALPNSLPHIKSGGVRALAVLSAKRTPALPDVPTMGETIAGFEVTPWTALGVPSGTPAEIVERLNREINAGLADPGVRARMAEVGGVPLVYSPAELRALIASDAAKWARVVEQAGIKPE